MVIISGVPIFRIFTVHAELADVYGTSASSNAQSKFLGKEIQMR